MEFGLFLRQDVIGLELEGDTVCSKGDTPGSRNDDQHEIFRNKTCFKSWTSEAQGVVKAVKMRGGKLV